MSEMFDWLDPAMANRLTAPAALLRFALTCDPADFVVSELSGDPGHMRPQTVTQQMDPLPGQRQLFLRETERKR